MLASRTSSGAYVPGTITRVEPMSCQVGGSSSSAARRPSGNSRGSSGPSLPPIALARSSSSNSSRSTEPKPVGVARERTTLVKQTTLSTTLTPSMAQIANQDRVVELRGAKFEVGGKSGNVVIQSKVMTVHKGWRAVAIDGRAIPPPEMAAALRAVQQRPRYTVTFRIGDVDLAAEEEAARKRAEEEEAIRRQAAEEADRRYKEAQEIERRRAQEESKRRREAQEAEQKRLQEVELEARRAAELADQERRQKEAEEEAQKKQKELEESERLREERERNEKELDERRRKLEEERVRQEQLEAQREAQRQRLAEDAERRRQEAERRQQEAEERRLAAQEEARREAEEAERRREHEELCRQREAEARRKAEAEEQRQKQEDEKRKRDAELQRKAAEDEKQRQDAERKRKELEAEAERQRQAEEADRQRKAEEAEKAERVAVEQMTRERKVVEKRLQKTLGLLPREKLPDPAATLMKALAKKAEPAKKKGGPCDKCDGPHHEDDCPHFKGKRDNHRDAFDRYGKKGDAGGDAGGQFILKTARVIPQPGDGSCLFHSISYGLRGSNATDLRAQIADFIAKNPDLEVAGNPIRDWVLWDSGMDVKSYAKTMRTGSKWGGAVEIAVCAQLKGIGIHIYERGSKGFARISTFGEDSSGNIVNIHYGGRVHYDALQV